MDSGKQSVKVHFRRGRVRILMGQYDSAKLDLNRSLELLADDIHKKRGVLVDGNNYCELKEMELEKEQEKEKAVIMRKKQKLTRLVNQAEKNKRMQKKAMEKLFQSNVNDNDNEKEKKSVIVQEVVVDDEHLGCFQWYARMMGRCAQRILDVIGDGEGDIRAGVEVPVYQDVLNELIQAKKDE